MSWVPLNAMCSNMWARPVIPVTSCAEPTSTSVSKEKTGASGRRTRTNVQPFGSTWTVVRASKSLRDWAAAGRAGQAAEARRRARAARIGCDRLGRVSGIGVPRKVGGNAGVYVAASGKFIRSAPPRDVRGAPASPPDRGEELVERQGVQDVFTGQPGAAGLVDSEAHVVELSGAVGVGAHHDLAAEVAGEGEVGVLQVEALGARVGLDGDPQSRRLGEHALDVEVDRLALPDPPAGGMGEDAHPRM